MSDRRSNVVDVAIGKRIGELRAERGLCIETMADMLLVEPSQLEEWEAGQHRVHPSEMFSIADALGVTIGAFFQWNGSRLVIVSNEGRH